MGYKQNIGATMKMYDYPAPNAQKVKIFAHEKDITIEYIQVDLLNHELRTPEMLSKNPMGTVPFLELEDGEVIRESRAIIEYLEGIKDSPNMLGKDPLERARIHEIDRLAELGLMIELAHYVHNISPFFADKGPQSKEAAEMALNCYKKNLHILEDTINGDEFLIFNRPTVADCTLFSTFTFAESIGVTNQNSFKKIMSWHEKFGKRKSAES
ncbi:MAG: glutathione S-transferase family protein [Alphaproteobacteria bacterium]